MKKTFLTIACLAVFLVVGAMDAEDERKEAEHYKEMVCGGYWPDYKQLNVECGAND